MKETIVKINKTKSRFFENIKKKKKKLQDFSQTHQEKREKNQINKIRNENESLKQTVQKYKGL